MKQLFHRFIGVSLVGIMSMMSMAFAQQSFLKQNLTNAPALPGDPSKGIDLTSGSAGLETTINGIIAKISSVINWVLGLLALVSVIILIYTGVKMLLNSSDDKALDEGYKTIKNIFVALLFIGASWLIVQFIFYIVSLFVK